MKDTVKWDLILDYLENNLNRTREAELKEWINEDSGNQIILDRLSQIWNNPQAPLPEPDIELAWVKFREKALLYASSKDINENKPAIIAMTRAKVSRFLISPAFRAAAIILIIFSVFFLWQKTDMAIEMKGIFVENGRYLQVTLPDSTQIILDAGSTLRYPSKFSQKSREVYLNGEAYFAVTPDPHRPFSVNTDDAQVTVLGTKFNVRSWNENNKVTVAVEEGKVSFKSVEKNISSEEVIITPGKISEKSKGSAPEKPEQSDVSMCMAWMHKEMHFRDVKLQEVFDQLQRWYDIDISCDNSNIAENRVTIHVTEKPVTEILNVIALMNNLEYWQENNHFTFYQN